MAQIPPPKRSTKGAPPTTDEALNNLAIPDTGDLAPLNFKVEPSFRKEFKTYASRLGISMKELLDRSFREYQRVHPLDDDTVKK
jgi:hypothetical protein